jgi:hypothetical protein
LTARFTIDKRCSFAWQRRFLLNGQRAAPLIFGFAHYASTVASDEESSACRATHDPLTATMVIDNRKRKNQMPRIASAIAGLAILLSPAFFGLTPRGAAQNGLATPELDYYSLAITSILNSAAEASKLPDVPQRVKLLINAARILPPSQHDEAVGLLDAALRDLKHWGSEDKASWGQRHEAMALRNDVLALYAKLDPEKAMTLQKEFQAAAESSTSNSEATSHKEKDWYTQFSDRRAIADQAAKVALSLIDTDPEKASALVVQSLQGGTVSNVLYDILQKQTQNGNRAILNKLEIGIGQVLAANVTLDPFSLVYARSLAQFDKDMPPAVSTAFVSFFMRSLQTWSALVTGPGGDAGFVIDTGYITTEFTMFTLNARPVILQYSPEQLLTFDLALDQVAPLVPEKTRARLNAFHPETFSDPRDRLNDILKDPNPVRRDGRLMGLVSELLRNESADSQKNLDLAADVISGFSDPDNKAAFTDLLTITRMNALVKQKKFIEAQQLAGAIPSEETRAWALLALATVAAKADRVLGFELISNALKALDKASPSPHKVELALIATAMLARDDPERAFDTLLAASRYANSSASKVDPPTKPAVAFGLDAKLGEAHTRLGVFPESLGGLEIDPSLSVLATTDWFRAQSIADDFHEPALRLSLKLRFAEGVLAEKRQPAKKTSAKRAGN